MINKDAKAGEIVWQDRKHWLWFPFSFTKYTIKNDRLYVDAGLFKTVSDETLLYRVTDLRLERTLGQKLCGTGTIVLKTRVDSHPVIELRNIKNSAQVKDYLSEMVESIRTRRNVVGKEFYGSQGMVDLDGDGIPDIDVDEEM